MKTIKILGIILPKFVLWGTVAVISILVLMAIFLIVEIKILILMNLASISEDQNLKKE